MNLKVGSLDTASLRAQSRFFELLHPCSIVQLGIHASRSPKKTLFSFNGSPLTQRACERSQGFSSCYIIIKPCLHFVPPRLHK
jgi:hypothetical protein